MVRERDATRQPTPHDIQLMSKHRVLSLKPQLRLEWRGQGRPERKRAARSFRQLRRFHHGFNSDKVFGTHKGFLIAQGKYIVPTEAGLSLFGVLKQADPALVDPGVTAQLECLLDDVVVGKQEMVGAIDAVCDVALRIIGKLTGHAATGGPHFLGALVENGAGAYPPNAGNEALC
jgi:hypothetical protein